MKKWLAVFAGVAVLTSFAPAASVAQGVGIDLPGVGVRIGEPHPHYGYTYRYEEPRVYHAPAYREREVYLRDRDCRTVTIREDGFTRRIRRCD
jgi:hypothetical protein